jgi:hypothetical protein
MFEQDMERLEHELDNALLFYYAAQSAKEKESCILRGVEVSLDRLQCCLEALMCESRIERLRERTRDCLKVSDYLLHEGISNFVRVGCFLRGGAWSTLTARAMHLHEELLDLLKLEPSTVIGHH